MRDYQIKMEPFGYIALLNLKINQEINQHAKAMIEVRIKEDLVHKYLDTLVEETWVKLYMVDEEGKHRILFHGIVTDFEINTYNYDNTMKLEITSGTFLMDLQEHFRTFQSSKMLNSRIYTLLSQTYEMASAEVIKETELGRMFVQYKETDWVFAKRLASQNNVFLTPIVHLQGIRYTVGLPSGWLQELEEGTKILKSSKVADYLEKTKNGMTTISRGDILELTVITREIYNLGDYIFHSGRKYYIYKWSCSYQNGECIHTYCLQTQAGLQMIPIQNTNVSGCSFDAVVTKVRQDKVMIDIAEDEHRNDLERKWFLYSTVYSSPDGTGWYCMPEIGDSVRLYIPEKEEDSFVISSVHMETSSARQNPDNKSFKTKHGKEILFTPDRLIITNNKGMSIEMSDEEGIFIGSDKEIMIQAKQDITVSSQNAALLIAAEDRVQVQQGGTVMTLNDDISFAGGEFRIQ